MLEKMAFGQRVLKTLAGGAQRAIKKAPMKSLMLGAGLAAGGDLAAQGVQNTKQNWGGFYPEWYGGMQ